MDLIQWLRECFDALFPNGVKDFSINNAAFTIAISLVTAYLTYILVYGLFVCPTRHIPGHFLSRFGQVYWRYLLLAGSVSVDIRALHLKYGTPIAFLR
jgi:hypothetical protein